MIIQVAGTNGSGKSTVVRAVMRQMDLRFEHEQYCDFTCGTARVRVLGPYPEGVDTGGCDRIRSLPVIQQLTRSGCAAGYHVIWEGASSHGGLNQTRGLAFLGEGGLPPYVVVLLTTPLAVCLEGIGFRRTGRGAAALVDATHIQGNYTRARNYAARMRDAGARVIRVSRDEAPGRILELLRGA